MSETEERAPRPPIGWFAAKIAFSAAWLMACAFAARALVRSDDRTIIVAAALLIMFGPVVWLLAKAARLARADEAERSVMLRGLAQGLLFAIAWPGAVLGGSVISSLYLGAGVVNESGLMQNALTYIALLPPLAFFISELNTFALLTVFARKPKA